jgi:hypothetical protein
MTSSQSATIAVTVTQVDVLYVGQQINLDLQALSEAYPDKLSLQRATSLFNSYTTFLYNYAISTLGFSLYDPSNKNLVYHEYRYEISYGGQVSRRGTGGQPVRRVWLPSSVTFQAWVIWSNHMLNLPIQEQRRIVQGTGWNIPGQNGTFNGQYVSGTWSDLGGYSSGALTAKHREYRIR